MSSRYNAWLNVGSMHARLTRDRLALGSAISIAYRRRGIVYPDQVTRCVTSMKGFVTLQRS
jgi:hypothetical protein